MVPRKLLVINDVSERQRDSRHINKLLQRLYPNRHSVVNASEIRRRVFSHLASQKKKYDLIFLGDRGGTLLFTGSQLKQFGSKIARMPYSRHMEGQDTLAVSVIRDLMISAPVPRGAIGDRVLSVVRKELAPLGEKPRILLLEGDAGEFGYTAYKLREVRNAILNMKKGASVHVVVGAATRGVEKQVNVPMRKPRFTLSTAEEQPQAPARRLKFRYVAYPAGGDVVRLSEIIEKEEMPAEKLRELRRRRGLQTGTLPH